jgi:hypothetical protein
MKRFLLPMPMLLSALLVGFTASVYRYSYYGTWHIYPALAMAPLVVLCHAVLILRVTPRMPVILYAVMHLLVFFPLWFWCLIRIGGS